MITITLTALLAFATVSLCDPISEQLPIHEGRPNSPFDSRFDALVKKTLSEWHVPGLAIAVADENKTFTKGYGVATFPDTPVTPDTMFFGGSTSKAFTSAALSFLVEDQKHFPGINWDTPISQIIRDDFVLEDGWYTDHVTLEDAASHRSGLPRHDLTYPTDDPHNATTQSIVRLLRFLPLTAPIRTKFQYCNLMYITLSHVIQTLVKKPLHAFLSDRIWGPLNMTSTTFSISDAQAKGDLARGYTWVDSKCNPRYLPVDYVDLPAVISGAGATISTVGDYAKWARSLMYQLPPLSSAQHQAIMKPRSMMPSEEYGLVIDPLPFIGPQVYSLGWEHMVYRGEEFVTHTGLVPGFGAHLLMIPSRKWAVALFANTKESSIAAEMILSFDLIDNLLHVPTGERYDWNGNLMKLQRWRKKLLTNMDKAIFPDVPSPPLPYSLPTLSDYAGVYWNPAYASINLTFHARHVTTGGTASSRGPSGNKGTKYTEYLRLDHSYRVWDFVAHLNHVSGDYFMLEAFEKWPQGANVTECDDDDDDGVQKDGELVSNSAAKFDVGPDGKIRGLGIALENEMIVKAGLDGKKISDDSAMMWFEKTA